MSDPRPIGVFDSGVGGLTVLREILRRLPRESTIYLGDNARAPYGPRPDDEVLAFSRQAVEQLGRARRQGDRRSPATPRPRSPWPISAGAMTCRSWASSARGRSTAALSTRNRRVGVIATSATVRSHAYFQAIKEENPAIEVYEHATPALVPLVEAGRLRGPEVEAIVREVAAPGSSARRRLDGTPVSPSRRRRRIDTLLLGCTHYPLIAAAIRAATGERIALVDSATATAARSWTCSRSTASRRRARAGGRPPTRAGRPRPAGAGSRPGRPIAS